MLSAEKEYRRGDLDVHHPDDKQAHDDYVFSLTLAVAAAMSDEGKVEEVQFSSGFNLHGNNRFFKLAPRRRVR